MVDFLFAMIFVAGLVGFLLVTVVLVVVMEGMILLV
jgi:hypothetical protein